jgi:Icc-related predicted phosphoesterase
VAEVEIFFASDIHGSETCFRKFVNAARAYEADVVILGGDITGKLLVPITPENGGWMAVEGTAEERFDSEDGVNEYATRVRAAGAYPVRVSRDELEQLKASKAFRDETFERVISESVESWVTLADERLRPLGVDCYIGLGNDDDPLVAELLRQAGWVVYPEGRVLEVRGHEMISWGWSGPTPWDTPREQQDDELERSITTLAEQVRDLDGAIFNLHNPPFRTGLDVAPLLTENLEPVIKGGEQQMASVGSGGVRRVIERFHPLVALHGHVHESRAAKKLGRTLCLNPGSSYQQGVLRGARLRLKASKVARWTFTTG